MSTQDPNLQKPAAPEEHPVFSETPVFQPPVKLKHSGPGIASFIMSLVSLIGYIILAIMVINLLAHFGQYQAMNPEVALQQTGTVLLPFIFLGSLLLNCSGLVVGIIGIALKNRKKTFAITGLIINALIIVGFIALLAIGLSVPNSTADIYPSSVQSL
jgi:heme/copper-type cytochrome/quinol oxidase subunit 3